MTTKKLITGMAAALIALAVAQAPASAGFFGFLHHKSSKFTVNGGDGGDNNTGRGGRGGKGGNITHAGDASNGTTAHANGGDGGNNNSGHGGKGAKGGTIKF